MTTTSTKNFCMSCVLDREIDPQTGRCLNCGHQVLKAPSEPKPDRNAGVPSRSPSQAYRAAPTAAPEVGEEAREAEYERRRARGEHALSVAQQTSDADVAAVKRIYPELGAPFDASKNVAVVNGVTPAPQPSAPDAAIANKPAVADVADTLAAMGLQPLNLHDSGEPGQPTPEWLAQTRALASGFITAAETAEKLAVEIAAHAATQVAGHKADAARLRRSARIYERLLAQIEGGGDNPAAPSERPWARTRAGETFMACRECGKTTRNHKARGYCDGCYRNDAP